MADSPWKWMMADPPTSYDQFWVRFLTPNAKPVLASWAPDPGVWEWQTDDATVSNIPPWAVVMWRPV